MIGEEYQSKKVARNRAHGAPEAFDVHIGRRVRKRRTLLGISQAELAETLELVRAYYKINGPLIRRRIFELRKQLGKTFDDK